MERCTNALVVDEIVALLAHYKHPPLPRDSHAYARYFRDFAEVLAGKSADAVRSACAAWKADHRNVRMPTPGQLLADVERWTDPAIYAAERAPVSVRPAVPGTSGHGPAPIPPRATCRAPSRTPHKRG
jgi:hypothetical protein